MERDPCNQIDGLTREEILKLARQCGGGSRAEQGYTTLPPNISVGGAGISALNGMDRLERAPLEPDPSRIWDELLKNPNRGKP